MPFNILFFLLIAGIVKIKCEPQTKNSTKSQNDTMEEVNKEINKHKRECENSKEEMSESKYFDTNVDTKNNKTVGNGVAVGGGVGRGSGAAGSSIPDTNVHHTTYGNYGYGQHDYPAERSGYGPDPYASRMGYGDGYIRSKRSGGNEESQCISQCIFGNLEVLDDDRSPSEYALIKWFQDNLEHDETRIKLIRDVRRCFGQLAVSDTGDGCDFSKSISKCLRLDIED